MVTKSDFVLEWDKALGFRGDPFTDKILGPINTFLVNRKDEKEKLNWFFIKNYSYGAIIGEAGVGKTMLLKWLEDRLGRYNRIHSVYINAAVFKEQVNILQKMIIPLLSFYEKTFSKPHLKLSSPEFTSFLKKRLEHKSVALLIDNAHHLIEKNLEIIKSLRKEGLKLQVIVTSMQKEYEKSRLGELGQDELGISLRRLSYDESKEMVVKRIEAFGGKGIYPFSEESLKEIYDKVDKNPKEFLKMCRDEAIKILIHKREALEKGHYSGVSEAKPLKTGFKKTIASDEKMDIKIRKADKKEVAEEKKEDKKKLIRIRFAFGKDADKPRRASAPVFASEKEERKAIYDDEHKEALVNRLSSTSPRRKPKPEPEKKEYLSESDKLLKELAEEFEVK
jgi:type II secretory pathway predicted ATPase ExeA